MKEHNFDEILDFLCDGIMLKSKKQSVRDELFDHLMCKYETNIAVGMDEETAKISAINDLGDKNLLKFKLSQVHHYNPELSMKKAMNLLMVGYAMSVIQINIIPNMDGITKLIGVILMLVATFCLGKSSDILKKAFIVSSVSFTADMLIKAFSPLIYRDFGIAIFVLYAIIYLLNIAYWGLLLFGLCKLTEPYVSNYKMKIYFGMSFIFNSFSQAIMLVLVFTGIVTDEYGFIQILLGNEPLIETNGKFSEIVVAMLIYALCMLCFTLPSFRNVSKCLLGSDHEYRIEDSTSKKVVAGFLALIIAIVPATGVEIFRSTQEAEISPLIIDDYDISDVEYEKICNVLLTYKIPEKYVYALPKSEIRKFSRIVPSNGVIERAWDFYSVDGFKYDIFNCTVSLTDEEGYPLFKPFVWIEYGENENNDKKYTDYLAIYKANKSVSPNYPDKYNGDTILILSEENGQLMRNEPLEVHCNGENFLLKDAISGVSYQAKENLAIFYSTTYRAMSREEGYADDIRPFEIYHRTFPVTTLNLIPEKTKDKSFIIGCDMRYFVLRYYVYTEGWEKADAK